MSCGSCGNKGHGMDHCPASNQRDAAPYRYSFTTSNKPNRPANKPHDPSALVAQNLTKLNDQMSGFHERLDDIAQKVLIQQDRNPMDQNRGQKGKSQTRKIDKIQGILNSLQKDF